MAKKTTETQRLPTEQYYHSEVPAYVDVHGFSTRFAKWWARPVPPPVLITGPKGVAKSLSVKHFAAKGKIPVVTFDCSEDVRRTHLVGMHVMGANNTTPFMLGALTAAIDVANEVGECILNLEELNALNPQTQKILNPLTDFRRRIEVTEVGSVYELKKGVKLWVVGTSNTSVYGGVYQLNEDLKSRFRILSVKYPEAPQEAEIIASQLKHLKLDQKLVKATLTLAHETRQQAMEYALSPRDVIQFLEDAADFGVQDAIQVVAGKFEGTDKDAFLKRAQSTFGK